MPFSRLNDLAFDEKNRLSPRPRAVVAPTFLGRRTPCSRNFRNRQGDVRARVRRITRHTWRTRPALIQLQVLLLLEARLPPGRAQANQLQRPRYAR